MWNLRRYNHEENCGITKNMDRYVAVPLMVPYTGAQNYRS